MIKNKRSKTIEDGPGKNLLCQDLEQLSSTKKKIFWLKNGDRFYGTPQEFQDVMKKGEEDEGDEMITKSKIEDSSNKIIQPIQYW